MRLRTRILHKQVAQNAQFSITDVEKIIDSYWMAIKKNLMQEMEIELDGIGIFRRCYKKDEVYNYRKDEQQKACGVKWNAFFMNEELKAKRRVYDEDE